MFKRLELETWHDFVPYIAFFITFVVFMVILIRAVRLAGKDAEHMAALPLDREPETKSTKTLK